MHRGADAAAEADGLRDLGRADLRRGRPGRNVSAICQSGLRVQSELLGVGARDVADRRHGALDRTGAGGDPARHDAAVSGRDDFLRDQCPRARDHARPVRRRRAEGHYRPCRQVGAIRRWRMTTSAATREPLLRIEALTKSFGGFVALDNINVDIAKGERFGLIGPNGSGKTTLVNCIAGALRPNKGSVVFAGEDITLLPPNRRSHRGIARSFQIPRPFRSMTVLQNLMVALDFAGNRHLLETEAHRREVAMSILTRIGLAGRAAMPTAVLTQVELRKMELARALASGPKLLISDEAMAGLSTSEVDEVLDLLMSLGGEDIAIIMIEHIMQALMRFSQRVMCLDAGRIIAIGAPSEVMANARVQEAYLGS